MSQLSKPRPLAELRSFSASGPLDKMGTVVTGGGTIGGLGSKLLRGSGYRHSVIRSWTKDMKRFFCLSDSGELERTLYRRLLSMRLTVVIPHDLQIEEQLELHAVANASLGPISTIHSMVFASSCNLSRNDNSIAVQSVSNVSVQSHMSFSFSKELKV